MNNNIKIKRSNIVAIVVTYNRKELLLNCITNLLEQSERVDIIIVDNNSSDGTKSDLISKRLLENHKVSYLYLNENTGGAGGFNHGLNYAIQQGWDWFWLMDDDAEPDKNALKNLKKIANNPNHIYGSSAISSVDKTIKLCFPVKVIKSNHVMILDDYKELAPIQQVAWLPFLGFFIHRNLVKKIGYPDKNFFIRNDDIEYAERAKKSGAEIYLTKESVIHHPFQPTITYNLVGKKFYYRSMAPWKVYYEIRNKIIIAKRHYTIWRGLKSLTGASLQVMMSIALEKEKIDYLRSYYKGITDGIKSS